MTELKGGDILIHAMAGVARQLERPIPVVMAGDGPQRKMWERLAARERVDAVFTGWLDPAQRHAALSRAAVLAVPSVWPEPFGLVGLEAAAMGVPAVAFDTGGIRQWLRDGVSGLLLPPSSGHAGLAAALSAVLRDPTRRAHLSAGALGAAREMSVDAQLAGLEQVLRRAASTITSPPAAAVSTS
jgi:glycosyltransferase involved in cell wall biosynthesis